MKYLFLGMLTLLMVNLGQAQIKGGLGQLKKEASKVLDGGGNLSQDEIGKGLKEALEKGAGDAVSFLSAKDGYYKSAYKILLPEEAQKVTKKLSNVPGFENVEADLVERLNRAAELAATKAKPILVKAITNMSFKDAMSILKGNKDAATRYLEKSTFDALFADFQPVIKSSLDEVNATEYWNKTVTAYNRIPMVEKTNPDLDKYVTQRALNGMFGLVEKKEADIRSNPSMRSSDLLKKVFGQQD